MNMTKMSLYQRFIAGGVPPEEIDHHYSDLYVKVTLKSKLVLEEFMKTSPIKCFVERFKANDGSGWWYDIAFAYDPYWEMKAKGVLYCDKCAS